VATLALCSLLAPAAATATVDASGQRNGAGHRHDPVATMLTSGLQGSIGSTIGPDGALYVPEGQIGQVTRIDPRTGAKSAYATGLPTPMFPIGGVMDIAFVGRTAYVLVTNVGDDIPGDTSNEVDGIYRIDDSDSFTVIADVGDWSKQNPPPPDIEFFLARGVHYAMEPTRGGFLVTDGHHNRVVKASMNGDVRLVKQFGNTVPTGLATIGGWVFMAEAGPVPHGPSTGKVVAFGLANPRPRVVASGASLLTDVEVGPCGLYAVSQGDSPGDVEPGSPALPDSGELLKVNRDGSFTTVTEGLDLPTSVSFRHDTAYVVTLNGEVWKIRDVSSAGWRHRGGGC
jgi:hypothetical protein